MQARNRNRRRQLEQENEIKMNIGIEDDVNPARITILEPQIFPGLRAVDSIYTVVSNLTKEDKKVEGENVEKPTTIRLRNIGEIKVQLGLRSNLKVVKIVSRFFLSFGRWFSVRKWTL